MQRKLLFIVNPNAGKKISDAIIRIIHKEFPKDIHYQIVIWKNKDQFEEINHILKNEGCTDAIAVGGDGTVNRVASVIQGTAIRLGIVPIGSGNGLARSLGLSMNIETAIKQIVQGKSAAIDSGIVNGQAFFCTSGLGFDAHIAYLFAQSNSRGLKTYIKIITLQLLSYRAKEYRLVLDGKTLTKKAFLITVANSGQYGNDFYIAPEAKLNDGLLQVVILKPFTIFQLPVLLTKILRRKAHTSGCIETFVANTVSIYRTEADSIHFDGEPKFEGKELNYSIAPASLQAIVGPAF